MQSSIHQQPFVVKQPRKS